MIGQYLSNNNEKRYSAILPKISDLNQPLAKETFPKELKTPILQSKQHMTSAKHRFANPLKFLWKYFIPNRDIHQPFLLVTLVALDYCLLLFHYIGSVPVRCYGIANILY
jgi:hypothetical protein